MERERPSRLLRPLKPVWLPKHPLGYNFRRRRVVGVNDDDVLWRFFYSRNSFYLPHKSIFRSKPLPKMDISKAHSHPLVTAGKGTIRLVNNTLNCRRQIPRIDYLELPGNWFGVACPYQATSPYCAINLLLFKGFIHHADPQPIAR